MIGIQITLYNIKDRASTLLAPQMSVCRFKVQLIETKLSSSKTTKLMTEVNSKRQPECWFH